MGSFTVYPAIDLRRGQVVRLSQGDPSRQTAYDTDPAAVARRWMDEGASWLHVVNLDGAFGETGPANENALAAILETGAQVQFGGGLRGMDQIASALSLGVARAVLGTAAVEDSQIVAQAVEAFGAERIAVGVDARQGSVRLRGWTKDAGIDPFDLGSRLSNSGLATLIVTDITRDGVGGGVNLDLCKRMAEASGLSVIASGGVQSLEDVRRARVAGMQGVIIGRALYEGQIKLSEALAC